MYVSENQMFVASLSLWQTRGEDLAPCYHGIMYLDLATS